jgi:hypothetical protein
MGDINSIQPFNVTNPIPYKCAQPRHSNEAAMGLYGTVATVLTSKSGVLNYVSCQALIDMIMVR